MDVIFKIFKSVRLFFIVILCLNSVEVLADESREQIRNGILPLCSDDDFIYPGLNALVDVENGYRREKGKYLEDDELSFFAENKPVNLKEKNEYVRVLYNHSRKYFYQNEKEKLEFVYNALSEIIELDDELNFLKQLEGRVRTKHYFENKNWYDRYAAMVEINYWRWYLGTEGNIAENLKKFKNKYDETYSGFPFYMENEEDAHDAWPIRVGKFPVDVEGGMLLALLSMEPSNINLLHLNGFMKENGATIEKMEDDVEYFNFHVDSMNSYVRSFKGKYDGMHYESQQYFSVVFLEQRYLYRNGLLKIILGKTAVNELRYLQKIREYTYSQCTLNLWNTFSAWIVDLAMQDLRASKTQATCEANRQVIIGNLKYLNARNGNVYTQSALRNLDRNIHNENYCAP